MIDPTAPADDITLPAMPEGTFCSELPGFIGYPASGLRAYARAAVELYRQRGDCDECESTDHLAEAILDGLSYSELRKKAIYLMALNANQARTIDDFTAQAAPEALHTFLNAAAGAGLVIGDVDAADLYIAIFPERYAQARATPPVPAAVDAGAAASHARIAELVLSAGENRADKDWTLMHLDLSEAIEIAKGLATQQGATP